MQSGNSELETMTNPSLSEAWDQEDDWTGITCAKERRKRQNRIHQRAYRKRAHMKPFSSNNAASVSKPETSVISGYFTQPESTRRYQSRLFLALLERLPILMLVRCPEMHDKIAEFLRVAFTNWGLNLPTISDLPWLTRLNTFDALARNALLLQIPLNYLETDEHQSVFNLLGPHLPETQPAAPHHLAPTQLQRAVTHHSWLDLFPIPGMRDNILRGIDAGQYDEDQLCDALCCDLLDTEAGTNALLIVWGESWDATSWEFSPEFFRRWGHLLEGCAEVLRATNFWRGKRGEAVIECVEF